MQFKELIKEVKSISIETLRQESGDYFEAVFLNTSFTLLTARLEKFFGSPVWPSEKELSAQVNKMIEGYGGIMAGQTLYLWNEKVDYILAMLWPWRDGAHFTVKIFKKVSLS